jgi:adenylate cyclase
MNMVVAAGDPTNLPDRSVWATRLQACLEVLGLTATDDVRLPERVRRAIRHQEETSEILVGLLQVVAIVFFAALYSLTPKAFPPDVPFEPVPWTLSIYAAFTLLRLWLAMRRRLPPWFLRLSVIVDISVLMVTIWSFHLQYQAPAALYLKAPTFMYVFILITLRALRFDAVYVLLAGGAAVVGWLLLVAYAFFFGDPTVTHSFVDYATSYQILLGAEIDKLIPVIMVTLILAIVLRRARRMLVSAVAEHQAATDLARFLDPDVASQVRASELGIAPGEGVLREAAVLFTDLRGFTALSRTLDPRATIRLIGEYAALLVPVVQMHGGSIDKYLGDGIMASFGATRPSPTYAADALTAVQEILAVSEAWNRARLAAGEPAIEINAAVATGPVLFGVIGHESRLEYTVMGDPVNLAAKLEKHAKREQARAVATAEAIGLARRQGWVPSAPCELRPGRVIEGWGAAVDVAVLG